MEDHTLDTTVHAVILGAGQGKRLLPLTESSPKCLLRVGGRTMLEWQMRALAACGVREVAVVTGFGADAVEAAAAEISARVGLRARTRHNPFYAVADNAGSCFVARDLLRDGRRVLMNGDTLFEPAVLARALTASAPVSVTVDRKAAYDADDMKVELDGTRLRAIGKTLPPERTGAESIGLLVFQDGGGALFEAALERVLRRPDGLRRWYLSAVDLLAAETEVGTVSIEGLTWCEVDVPSDLERAERLAQGLRVAEESDAARFDRGDGTASLERSVIAAR